MSSMLTKARGGFTEVRRKAAEYLATGLSTLAAVAVMLPLVAIFG